MHPIIQKTLGGLSKQYFFRNFLFGLVMAVWISFMSTAGWERQMPFPVALFTVLSTLLYPYSRFVYESVVGFILGENFFFVNPVFMLITKIITMAFCFSLAIFIAPVGLIYLYFYHSHAER